ncbi:MAG: hypothetical protein Q6370_010750 [Candidatus Sigynarchaeota archaeon]|jgi:hypothetical protein
MLKIFMIAVLAFSGCHVDPKPTVNAIIDCTLQNQEQITQLIAEFRPLLEGARPDWQVVYQRAKNAGKAIGGCALAQLVQEYLGNRAAPPPQADSWNAFRALERFRREEAGNATFRTAAGDL